MGRHLGAKICGAETCYLGARVMASTPRSKDEFKSPEEFNLNFLQKKD